MSKAIMILGTSGSGKTTAMRNLNPKETFYIDADGKGLSWKGWRTQYNKENKNYYKTDEPSTVKTLIDNINSKRQDIKVIVVDTLNGIMVGDEMRRCKENGYDKWRDLCQAVYDIVDSSNKLRDDLTVLLLGHTQTTEEGFTSMLTNGRKLNKIVLESKMTTVLISKCIDGEYVFETHANNSSAKTPMGAFESDTVSNDIVEVMKVLEDY